MRKFTITLSEGGKELGRREFATNSEPETGGPEHRGSVEYLTGRVAMELYRDCFWKRECAK